MFERLQKLADDTGVEFGLKLSNTFPVDTTRGELPNDEMYMSGRSLFPLTIEMCSRISRQFGGKMKISFAGGAEYIATHPDDVCPTEDGYDVDIGPFIRLFESLTGNKATVVGKPNRLMLDMAALEMGVEPDRVVMVGDRLSTDIRMAVDANIASILVLSGETDEALLKASGIRPTFVKGSVADIVPEEIVRTLSASDLKTR